MQVDVYHWGDSQIEGDRITGALREHFQKKHGGQGAGRVMPLTPAPTFAVQPIRHTGRVRRVAGFGPRRDEARRLRFFAVRPVRLGLDVDPSVQPRGARALSNMVEHGPLAGRRRPMGRLTQDCLLPFRFGSVASLDA